MKEEQYLKVAELIKSICNDKELTKIQIIHNITKYALIEYIGEYDDQELKNAIERAAKEGIIKEKPKVTNISLYTTAKEVKT